MEHVINNPSDKLVIYVGGLDDSIDEKILHAAFIPFGEIKTIEMPLDHTTELHKGFGFIEFEEYEDCLHAIDNMNDAELCGRIIRVNFARPTRFKEGYHRPIWMEEDYYKNKNETNEELDEESGSKVKIIENKENNEKTKIFFA